MAGAGSNRAGPIAVYGSTGFTGRLVARELARRGLSAVLSGRSEQKLHELASTLDGDVRVEPARVDDPASLERLLEGCAAVINCAGPFSLIGEPVVRAAIATGTHYLDTTGEQAFIKHVQDTYDARAGNAGVAVVPAMGLDFALGDMLARLVAGGLEPLDDLTLAYAVRAMRASRGTMLSAMEIIAGDQLAFTGGEWRPAPGRISTRRFDFPQPVGTQTVVPFPSGEMVTVPRHTQTRQVTCLITAATFAPGRLAPALPALMGATALAARTPLKAALKKALGLLPEGPSEEQRRHTSFNVVARARAGARSRQGMIGGLDVYGLTAVTTARGAAIAASAGYGRKGVLSPAQAFDPGPFLEDLREIGVNHDIDPLPAG